MFANFLKLDKSEAPYLCDEDFKLAFKSRLKTLQVDLSCAQFFEGDNYRSANLSFYAALCYVKNVGSMEEYYRRYGHKVQRLVLINTRTMTEFPYESVLKFCQSNPVEVLDMRNLHCFGGNVALYLPEYFNGFWIREHKKVYQLLKLILLPKVSVLPQMEDSNCFSLSKTVLNNAKYVNVREGVMYFGTIDIPNYISIQGLKATYISNVSCSEAVWEIYHLLLQKQICMQEMGEFLRKADIISMLIDFADFRKNSCGAIEGIHGWSIHHLIISGQMKYIKSGMFEDLKNLKSLKILDGVQVIDASAFNNCLKFRNIEYPKSAVIKDDLNPEISDVI